MSQGRPTGCLIVVLGSPNDRHGTLSSIARERLTLAAEEYQRQPSDGLLLTGGFGPHFNQSELPHAEHARSFLLSLAIPESAFVEFALSSNTIEDALLARPVVEQHGAERLVVVTSRFHLDRARYIFDRVFPNLEIRYAGAPHDGSRSTLRGLADHEARTLANLRALRGSSRDPLDALDEEGSNPSRPWWCWWR